MATKKRHPRNWALAAEIGNRLEELRLEKMLNYSGFPKEAGVPRSVYNAWRNSGRVPGGFYLRRMAERFGVTTDWLLGIEGAPKHSEPRGPAKREEDLMAEAIRGVTRALSPDIEEIIESEKPTMRAILREGIERVKAEKNFLRLWMGVTGNTEEDSRRFQAAFLAASIALELHLSSRRQR